VAFLAWVEAARVSQYRAYIIGYDGHIASFRTFVCGNDADATVWTKQLLDGHDIELWSGDRFVIFLQSPSKPGAVTYDVIEGRMVPKPAKWGECLGWSGDDMIPLCPACCEPMKKQGRAFQCAPCREIIVFFAVSDASPYIASGVVDRVAKQDSSGLSRATKF
jgi:hypothetical protein